MSTSRKLLVVYGTETGNAEAISRRIHQEALELKYQSTWSSLQHFRKIGLDKAETWPGVVIVVVSSTGQGDPPQNIELWWRTFRKLTGACLAHVHFALLGLGSSDYDSFQGFPTEVYDKFISLGAKEFVKRGKADEATGLEAVVEPWVTDLWVDVGEFFEKLEVPKVAPVATPAPAVPSPATSSATPAPVAQVAPPAVSSTPAASQPAEPANGSVKRSSSKRKKVPVVPKALPAASKLSVASDPSQPLLDFAAIADVSPAPNRYKPFSAPINWARRLTGPLAEKEVLHLCVSLKGSGLVLDPGQAVGVLVPNDPALVTGLLKRLESSPLSLDSSATVDFDKPIDIKALPTAADASGVPRHIFIGAGLPCSVRHAFTHCIDVTTVPSKRFLATLAAYCSDAADKAKINGWTSAAKLEDALPPKASLLDLLNALPSCKPPMSVLYDTLPPLQPRHYSVANSPAVHPDEAHFMFVIVDLPLSNGTKFKGLGSNFLKTTAMAGPGVLAPNDPLPTQVTHSKTIQIFPRLSVGDAFVLDKDPKRSVVMVGPGTGLAPFVGFLQHRRYLRDKESAELGVSLLFFGCRNVDQDFLLREEVEGFEKDKTLTKLYVAESRNAEKKEYVQDKLLAEGKEIARLMFDDNALLYFCGDVIAMLKDLREALVTIIRTHRGLDETQARDTVTNWTKSKRFIIDAWA